MSAVSITLTRVQNRFWVAFLSLAAVVLSGCQTAHYYRQAIQGQYQILASQRPIRELTASPQTPSKLKEKLQLVLKLRAFAEKELKLPADKHYLRYADLHRRFVVWNVHAAPELALEPKTWWYPFVGSLKYRGYFFEPDARSYAEELEEKGFDVYVEGVEAYSTLGWFADPVLNTFIHHEELELAEIIFHELAHQRLFVPGDTDFNEAFATAVAQEGVRRWLRAYGNPSAREKYAVALERNAEFVRLILAARSRLESIYGDGPDGCIRTLPLREDPLSRSAELHSAVSPICNRLRVGLVPSLRSCRRLAECNSAIRQSATLRYELKRRQKAEVQAWLRQEYQKLKAQWGGYSGYDRWFARSLNNAQLNTVATYYQLVPSFDHLLRTKDGDLERFYRDVRRLSRLSKSERHRQLAKTLAGRARIE